MKRAVYVDANRARLTACVRRDLPALMTHFLVLLAMPGDLRADYIERILPAGRDVDIDAYLDDQRLDAVAKTMSGRAE